MPNNTKTLKQKVISGLGWSAGAKFLGQLITWGITIVVIRLLTPEDYGLMALAGVFVAFLAMLNELGLGAAVVQKKNIDDRILRSLFSLILLTSFAFYLLIIFAAPLIAAFYDEPRLIQLLRYLSLQFFFMGFSVIPQSLLQRHMEFRKLATVNFFSAICGSAITLILALTGHGVWSLVWGSLMTRFISMVGLNLAQPFFYLPRFRMKGMWGTFSFGSFVTLSRMLWYFYIKSDTLIIGKILGKELLGFYEVGIYLAMLPMEKVSGLINQVAFPAFSSVQNETAMAGRHFLKAVRVMSLFTFPIFWGISSTAPEIVNIFLGSKWDVASLSLQIISLVIPLRMISNLMSPAAMGTGRADIVFINSLIAVVMMPVAFYIGSFWGLLGVSLAWVTIFPVVFGINLYRTVKILKISVNDVLSAMRMPFLSGLTMYISLKIIKVTQIAILPHAQQMLLLVFFGVVVYTSMTMIFNRKGFNEVKELIKGRTSL